MTLQDSFKSLVVDGCLKASPNFSFLELFQSDTADNHGIINMPNTFPRLVQVMRNLQLLCSYLELIREYFGSPILVTSGYRNREVNDLVGGYPQSYHLKGLAVDITTVKFNDFSKLVQCVKDSLDPFDEFYYEVNFKQLYIHIHLKK